MTLSKTAAVLGASGGIGTAVAERLAASGWSLYLHYNSSCDSASTLEKRLTETYPDQRFMAVKSDFAAPDGGDRLAAATGDIQAVVSCAGQGMTKLLSDTDMDDLDALWRVHVANPMRYIGLVSEKLRRHPVSRVVMIGSIWGDTGAAGEVAYSAVKGAVHAFVKAYAKEAAASNVLVNAVSPGWIETSMNSHLDEEERRMAFGEIPLMRPGSPEEVAGTVDFLLSEQSRYITGEIIKVNGGWYI
ncbi:3-oxoacyl-[acyl-carrier protein] reductase [Bhargavaea beijingensis]|uniref:3-oxoacyl-[acyl-carrier protein] reductase n=1 Tax=Bhargavaea beijingensis TaxID=426756 RepID=A0A1G7ATM3_9BACL|nr:SDR family oxidoreductase [Bhargavaea beijingensis]SDE18218.1 3-oxoacyl-[acyl-carrier protein] reductase [Bhargavaea beijingensis]